MGDLSEILNTAIKGFHWEIAVSVFAAYICIDALAAWYTLMVTKLDESRAAVADFFIYMLISFGVINYTQNFLYVLPMAFGGSIGTYLVVRWHRKHKRRISTHPARTRKKIR